MSLDIEELEEDGTKQQTLKQQSSNNKNYIFTKELTLMIYGFGDERNPYIETVNMLEDLVMVYINDIINKALIIGPKISRKQQLIELSSQQFHLTVEDILYVIRYDQRKYSRVCNLLKMDYELKKARKAFNENELLKESSSCTSGSGSSSRSGDDVRMEEEATS